MMLTPMEQPLPDFAALPPEVRGIIEELHAGKRPNQVHAYITRRDGSVEDLGVSENLRTTAGADWQANSMGSTAGRPAVADYIALTADSTAPAAGNTTLSGEHTTGGLGRAQGTYAHTNGTTSYTITRTFNATATLTAAKAGLFNAASAGTMAFETLLGSSAAVNNGDTLTITWTVNI